MVKNIPVSLRKKSVLTLQNLSKKRTKNQPNISRPWVVHGTEVNNLDAEPLTMQRTTLCWLRITLCWLF